MIIAIDGPSGSGKSTISKILAQKLGLVYIDTGAIYRTVAYVASKNNISWESPYELGRLSLNFPIKFKFIEGVNHVFYKNEDVTKKIRDLSIAKGASKVSAYPEVRAALLEIQRNLGNSNDSILDGRDIGTVIFPNASHKFFLDASSKVRAERRHKELVESHIDTTLEEVEKQIIERDKNDSTRAAAPLKKADDAIVIDTTKMAIIEVVNLILSKVIGN